MTETFLNIWIVLVVQLVAVTTYRPVHWHLRTLQSNPRGRVVSRHCGCRTQPWLTELQGSQHGAVHIYLTGQSAWCCPHLSHRACPHLSHRAVSMGLFTSAVQSSLVQVPIICLSKLHGRPCLSTDLMSWCSGSIILLVFLHAIIVNHPGWGLHILNMAGLQGAPLTFLF